MHQNTELNCAFKRDGGQEVCTTTPIVIGILPDGTTYPFCEQHALAIDDGSKHQITWKPILP